MWNAEGKNILVSLTMRLDSLRESQAKQVALLSDKIPDVTGMQHVVHELSRIREQVERCSAVRDKFSMANFNKTSLPQVMQEALAEIEAARQAYYERVHPGIQFEYDYLSAAIKGLDDLSDFLSGFSETPPQEGRAAA